MFETTFNPFIKHPISDEVFEIIYENGIKACYDSEQNIFDPYELIDYFYFVDSGMVSILLVDLNGKEQVLGIIGSGTSFGAEPLLFGISTGEVCAVAINPTVVYKIPRANFVSLVESSSIFSEYVNMGIISDTFTLLSFITNLTLSSPKKRLYDLLLMIESNDNNWYNNDYNYTQEQLAKIIGVSRTTLQNALYSLRDEGLIKLKLKSEMIDN